MDFDSLLKAHEGAEEKKSKHQHRQQQEQQHRRQNHINNKRKFDQSSNLVKPSQLRAGNMASETPADISMIANEVLGRDPKRQKLLQEIYQQKSRPASSFKTANGTTTTASTTQPCQRLKRHPGREKRKEGTAPLDKRVPCRFFKAGKCKEGKMCRFQHDGESFRMVCRHFKVGSCNKGDECNFIHDLSMEPCRFYHVTGKCDTGANCPFSHQPLNSELRRRLHALTGPCKYYHLKGFCTSGEECLFSHEMISKHQLEELKAAPGASEVQQIKPCMFHHLRGYCANGDRCTFSHAPLTQEQRIELQQSLKPNTPK
ncbi:hypothetical protein BDB00DRAFT_4889 [Zychaea mexicana]|uniref:uncharacterized protein n=1 Tax=Zychaea mexicana TaxID=64656 RepID=UPI0022FDE3A6|nr:uncharacterized protein BDB00DRAFT_4889 [Zychaea mexicana]KAI9499513.1 hypothetical protein BDB00DRAFT_4889 [Zychaea mexicana]